jgi:hypothetical protein
MTDPGGLPPEEYVQVLAYMLQMNGMPPGREPLPVDRAELGRIRLELGSAPPGPMPRTE